MPEKPFLRVSARGPTQRPWLSVLVLTYADSLPLVRRCVESLRTTLPDRGTELIVGANAPAPDALEWLNARVADGTLQRLLVSETNLFKCGMMRWMLGQVRGEHVWWFDDDSHVTDPGALASWHGQVLASSPRVASWGVTSITEGLTGFPDNDAAAAWFQRARWFRGLPTPGTPGGPDVWWFVMGGCCWMRTAALRAIDWPDPRLIHLSEDAILGEAIRQQGWHIANLEDLRIALGDGPTRGDVRGTAPLAEPPEP